MKKNTFCYHFILLFFLILCHCGNKASNHQSEIEQLIKNYTTAFDKKDFTKFLDYCTNDFQFFTLDGRAISKDSTANFLENVLANWTDTKTILKGLEVEVDGHLSYARYHATFHYTAYGKYGTMKSLITVIFRKNESGWKMLHFHMSRGY